ncbi:transposase [Candidatus Sumerlaeota bacterium]|nr:transposase [Candidatus Sumerlaeota bacterium]
MSRLRSPSEGIFCALKRWRRLGRAVYTGIVRVHEQATLAVLTHNLLKAILLMEKHA